MPRRLLCIPLLAALGAMAAPLVQDNFETLRPCWTKNVRGKATVDVAPGGVEGSCLRIEARDKAFAYCTTKLDPVPLRGKRITVRAMVKLENVVRGDKEFCEAKLHALVRFADKGRPPRNVATRFRGTADWHQQTMVVEIPEDATSLQIDLGIQDGDGIVCYDNLVIDDGVRRQICVDLRNIANTSTNDISEKRGHGGFLDAGDRDLRGFPTGDLTFADVDFYLMSNSDAHGRTCVVLAGAERPERPAATLAVAPVNARARRLFLLHAAAWADAASGRPCLFVDLTYADGRTHTIVVREGTDVGPFEEPADCPNWRLAWTGEATGARLGVGVSQWPLPWPEAPLRHLRLRSPGDAAVPVVLAVSLDRADERPPPPKSE